jgi:hypothetical protein
MDHFLKKHNELSVTPSDINEHLPILYKYASECESVLELGVRGVVSSWSLVAGLLNNGKNTKRRYILNDINECNIIELLYYASDNKHNLDIRYQWINDLELDVRENVDLTFIDTWHIYGQLKRELNKFSQVTNKYIIMHDTTLDGVYGETLRSGWDPVKQSQETGIPVDEITKGLVPAIEEFLANNKEWVLLEKLENNNGLTILKKIK